MMVPEGLIRVAPQPGKVKKNRKNIELKSGACHVKSSRYGF